MANELTYALTEDEYREALVRGAIALGILPQEHEHDAPNVRRIANGVLLEFGPSIQKKEPSPNVIPEGYPSHFRTDISLNEKEKVSHEVELYPTAVEVKEALSKVLERVPRINTIGNWSPEQKRDALAWANAVGQGHTATRPTFIVEPKERTKRSEPEPPKVEAPPAPTVRRGRRPVVQIVEEKGVKVIEEDLLPEKNSLFIPEPGVVLKVHDSDEPDPSSFFEEDEDPDENPSLA